MSTTTRVIDNHLASFGRGDLEAILSDYAPGAVFFTPAGPLKGIDAIRPFFVDLLADFAKPGSSFELKHRTTHGDHAYILWSGETAANRYDFATDTFVVRGGKIVAQSFAGKVLPKG